MIVIAGHLRLKPGVFDKLSTHMQVMIAASRAEKGCHAYSYGRDVIDPDTIRVFELWSSQDDLDRHFATPHLRAWRQALADTGIETRELCAYSTAASRPL